MQRTYAILSSVVYTAIKYSSTFSHKWHDFHKKFIEREMCVLIFSTNVWNISYSKKSWATDDQNIYWSSCKVPITLVWF